MEDKEDEYESIDNKYIIIKKIGEGNYGEVFLVKENNKENRKYAAKILSRNIKSFEDKIKLINKITKLNNPYIMKIIASSKEGKIKIKGYNNKFETKQYVIYEYVSKKTINEYLILPNSNILEEKYAKILFKYILKGIQAMHNAGICHRDIKLENILLDDFFKPKICDLGFCIECKNEKIAHDLGCGTYEYCAPEILRKKDYKPYDGMKADIFSLGITLLYMVTGQEQLDEFIEYKEDYNFVDYLNKTKIQIKNVSPNLQTLIIKMLDFDPEKRPSIETILDDPWMIDVKEDDLNQEKDLYTEFKRREDFIEENRKITILDKEEEDSKKCINEKNKSLKNGDENEINFEHEFIIKNIRDNNIELRDYLDISGKLNPFKFMNFIINKLNNEIKDGHVEANKNYYIIEIKYEYENKEDEGNDEDGNKGEEEEIDYKYGIFKRDLFIQIILFESENGNHILQFYKKAGEMEDYYKKLEKIISIIKRSIALYK